MKKYLRQMVGMAAAWMLLLPVTEGGAATWQQTLKDRFDIVDSFDELQDWGANGLYPSGAGDLRSYDASLLPKKLDGSNSLWGYWNNKYPVPIVGAIGNGPFQEGETVTNGLGAKWEYHQTYVLDGVTYLRLRDPVAGSVGAFSAGDTLTGLSSGATATITGWPKIIANHGSNTWRGSGKSLMMNLGDNDNGAGAMAGIGAQRLGLFFGNGVTGKSGYQKIHVFMMVKFAPTFFGVSGAQGDVDYISVFKFLDICSGFTSIKRFGSDDDQPLVEQTAQNTTEYGENQSIVNINGGGLSMAGRVVWLENIAVATLTPNSTPPTYYGKVAKTVTMTNNDAAYPASGADVNKVNPAGAGEEWFGLEIISDIGMTNTSDGSTELYIYDKNGNAKGHYSATGQLKLVQFDHYYNKITLGGNRRTGTSTSKTDGRYWIDDFIVHSSRIGPSYFQFFIPSSRVVTPTSNQQLRGTVTSTVEVSDDVAVTRVELYADGGTKLGTDTATTTGVFAVSTRSFSWNTATLANGVHTIWAKAYDADGNVGSSTPVTVTVSNPVVTSFTAPQFLNSKTIGNISFTAADYSGSAGITGYLITESSTPPAATAAGWSASAPASYIATSTGTHTLYPWAKDADGNVSVLYTSPRSVNVDTTQPAVTAFTAPSISPSLDISGITVGAADDAAGSGIGWYLITETAPPPAPDAAGWSSALPTSYSVASSGNHTLYPWVKDAAGNVSAMYSAPKTVDVVLTLSLRLDAPPRATAKTALVLAGTVLNGAGSTSVSVKLGDSVIWQQIIMGSTWSTTIAGLKPGDNVVLITAKDAVEEKAASLTITGGAGDLNSDGELTTSDALMALKMSVAKLAPTAGQLKAGDLAPLINGKPSSAKGVINASDALVILELAVGNILF